MTKELPSFNPSNHTVAAPLTSLLYDPLRTAKGLTTTEKRYAQIEKECLAIVEALNIFEWWLLGKSNTESIQTTNPSSWSSRRTSPQRPNVCRECFFSYSVITLLLCPYIYILYSCCIGQFKCIKRQSWRNVFMKCKSFDRHYLVILQRKCAFWT